MSDTDTDIEKGDLETGGSETPEAPEKPKGKGKPEKVDHSRARVTIEVAQLKGALKDVAGVVEARNTIPILSNILIDAKPEALTITATDLDMWAERHVSLDMPDDEAASMTPFAVTVAAGVFADIINKLSDTAMLTMAYDGGKLSVSAGRARFMLHTLPPTDFPRPVNFDILAQFEIPTLVLGGGIAAVDYAVSHEEVRFYLNGIYIEAHGEDRLRFVATDGNRLGLSDREQPEGAGTMPGMILGNKAVKVIDRLLDRAAEGATADICIGAGKLRFDLGEVSIVTKLVDGQFPDYQKVIPTANDKLCQFDPTALASAVDRVSVVASGNARAVKFTFDKNMITLSVASPEMGLASEEVPCLYEGDALDVGFNAKFLGEVLSRLGGQAEMLLADSAAPVLIRENEGSASFHVLMPMRV